MPRVAAESSVFAAVADPTRRAILDMLRDGERSASAMHGDLRRRKGARRISQPAFSQHLAVLRGARLVSSRREGRQMVYAFRHEPLQEMADWIAAYDRFWTKKLDALGAYLDATKPTTGKDGV